MTLTHLILEPLGLALAMMILGWLLERPRLRAAARAPAPSPRADEWGRPFGDWEPEPARPARAPGRTGRDEVALRWN